jgi:pyrroloquinoline-quinone synthase
VTLLDRLDAARERWNVLRHPFYERWSRGELEREELAFYAGQYRYAVVALADATERAARAAGPELRAELEQHAAEERAHVALWDDFAAGVGGPADAPARPETDGCVEAWTAGDGLAGHLAVLYAVEASQPAISETKLSGLVRHYGLSGDDPATAYFALHAERDREHAAQSRRALDGSADEDRLVELAEAALAANWELLDGVEREVDRR